VESGFTQNTTNNTMKRTYTLRSADWIYTPGMVRLAVDQYAFNPQWSVKMLRDGFNLPPKVAKGLASGAITYTVENESVTFTA
jgi:hypothetical protein